jgi:hypothetical protein
VVPAKKRFNKDRSLVTIPDVAHGDTSRTVDWAAEGFAKVSEGQIGDHKCSGRVLLPSTVAGKRRALVGPMTMRLVGL